MKRIALPVIAVIAAAALATVAGWLALDNTTRAQTPLPTLPAPANVQVVNGDNAGEVVVSWTAVAGASGYRIHWVDNDAAWDAHYAKRDWRNLILSFDVEESETTAFTLMVSNPNTGAAPYQFRVGSMSSPGSEPANWSAWQLLDVQGDFNTVTDLKALAAAISISEIAGELVALSGPTTAFLTQARIDRSATAIAGHKAALAAQLAILAETGYDARAGEIAKLVKQLESNADLIQQGRASLWRLLAAGVADRREVTLARVVTLTPVNETKLDDEFYGLVANSDNVSEAELLRLTHLVGLVGHAKRSIDRLQAAPTLNFAPSTGQLHELFDTTAVAADRDIEYLRSLEDPELEEVIQLTQDIISRGRGDDSLFDEMYYRNSLLIREDVLVAQAANIQRQLLHEIAGLATEVEGGSQPSTMPVVAPGEPGVTANEIRFGQSAVLEGPAAALGEGMKLGIEAAFHEANQAGGVNGRQLTLTTVNDYYEPYFAFSATNQLISRNRVFGLIGAVGTPTTRAALPAVNAAQVPFLVLQLQIKRG